MLSDVVDCKDSSTEQMTNSLNSTLPALDDMITHNQASNTWMTTLESMGNATTGGSTGKAHSRDYGHYSSGIQASTSMVVNEGVGDFSDEVGSNGSSAEQLTDSLKSTLPALDDSVDHNQAGNRSTTPLAAMGNSTAGEPTGSAHSRDHGQHSSGSQHGHYSSGIQAAYDNSSIGHGNSGCNWDRSNTVDVHCDHMVDMKCGLPTLTSICDDIQLNGPSMGSIGIICSGEDSMVCSGDGKEQDSRNVDIMNPIGNQAAVIESNNGKVSKKPSFKMKRIQIGNGSNKQEHPKQKRIWADVTTMALLLL